MTDTIRRKRRQRRPSVLPLLEENNQTPLSETEESTPSSPTQKKSSSSETYSNPRNRKRRTSNDNPLLDDQLPKTTIEEDTNHDFILQRAQITSSRLINAIDQIATELSEDKRSQPDELYWDGSHDWGDEFSPNYSNFLGSFE